MYLAARGGRKTEPRLDDLAILWQVPQTKPEMTCELDHRLVLRQDLAYYFAYPVPRRPIEEAPHQMSSKPSVLHIVLHDHGKLSHQWIVFADEPSHPHGLVGSLAHRDKGHVALVVEPSELVELRGCEFAYGSEETQPNIFGRKAVEESVVLSCIGGANWTNQESLTAGLPPLVRFRGIPRHATSLRTDLPVFLVWR
jgi:hypothetical protein